MIPVFDYLRGHERIREEVEDAMRRVLLSGNLILGPEGEAFEEELARYFGAKAAVAVGSGTDAIVIALRALGIGPGDEVVTVSHTAAATIGAIREVGAIPVWVDIQDRSMLIDPAGIAAHIGPRTRAILPVHLYGRPAEMGAIREIASRHALPIVEDCAQAAGARIGGRHVGTFGAIGCFSFYPTKTLGAYGDGGLCVTDDLHLAERMRRIRFHGFDSSRVVRMEGVNSRLDELQAAILRVKLRYLDSALSERKRIASLYAKSLAGAGLRLPAADPETEHAWHLFVIRSAVRARIIDALQEAEIGYGMHYPRPVHRMPAYRDFGYGPGSLPITERVADEVLSLPMYPELRTEEVQAVCRAICSACDAAAS